MGAVTDYLFGRVERSRLETAAVTRRSLGQGEVVGFVAANGAHVWRGLPYGASTGGANRWRIPQPAPHWDGVRPAVEFAPRCAQLTNQGDADDGIEPGHVLGSEDCLAIDVYAPPDAAGEALPVLVWIHGGGNVWGRSGLYDGSNLAVHERVIIVIPQFRVGPLGWFAHPALRHDAESTADQAASFALLDLLAALRWVGDNIGSFGGDGDCVTIFGESSGGHDVAALLASPLAAGLFHRAIIQSGSFDSVSLAEAEGSTGAQANTATELSRRLGATTADELRAVTVEQLYAVCETGDGWFLDVPRVIQDDVVLPHPLRDAFTSPETFHQVPIITGTNRDEMKLFYASDPTMTERRFGILPIARDQMFYDLMSHYVSRVWRIRAVDEPAQAMLDAGHDDVYVYRFDWDDGGRFLAMDFHELFGAAHGFEIPFVFNRFEHLGDADRFLFQKRTREHRERLSRAVGQYWASFARDGKPICPGRPDWPRYGEGDGPVLRLDTDNDGGISVVTETDTIDGLVVDLRNDGRLTPGQRAAIVDEMGKWMFTRPVETAIQEALNGW